MQKILSTFRCFFFKKSTKEEEGPRQQSTRTINSMAALWVEPSYSSAPATERLSLLPKSSAPLLVGRIQEDRVKGKASKTPLSYQNNLFKVRKKGWGTARALNMMSILILRAKVFLALTCKTNGRSRRELRYLTSCRCKFYRREKITECAILTIHLPLAQLGTLKFPLLTREDGKKIRKRHSAVPIPYSSNTWQFEEVTKEILSEDKIGVLKVSLNASCWKRHALFQHLHARVTH